MRRALALAPLAFGLWMHGAAALELTGITLFECDQAGEVNPRHRYNSGPVDAAWDLFAYSGPEASGEAAWLNRPEDHGLSLPLTPGTHTLTFHIESGDAFPFAGINLFFDGNTDAAGISALTRMGQTGQTSRKLRENRAGKTMGLPIADIPAAGTLVYTDDQAGLWDFTASTQRFRVTLQSFHFSEPVAGVDLVGPHSIGASGAPDHLGQVVLLVEELTGRPSELFLWLATQAGMGLGGPNLREAWTAAYGADGAQAPFSFQCGDEDGQAVLARSTRTSAARELDAQRSAQTLTYLDPKTGLEIRWEGVEYRDYKTVEWTVYFKNTGDRDTPILSRVQAIDTSLKCRPADGFTLRYNRGDTCEANAFEPLTEVLEAGETFQAAPEGGRGTNMAFPYYNLRNGAEGVILAVGWPGQWAASFTRDADRALHVTAGQQTTQFVLRPGEAVRTPLVVLQFSTEGAWIDAQNAWRRWMIQYNVPRPRGESLPLPMFAACSSHQFAEMTKADEQGQKDFIDSYLAKGLQIDYWWMDAGWYVGAAENNWPFTGTWEVDRRPHRFPNGLRAVTDYAHSKGVQSIVWFEPERVAKGTWLATEHPEWVLGGEQGGLLNLGDPAAWNWLVNHIDKILTDEGIDLYRQDYNIDPLKFWNAHDADDRQGMTENLYVQGYLAYWDELIRRHPGLLIDSCASGGRRNDLETMRRAVPLLRSDYLFEPVGQQSHTYGLSLWLPFFGTGYNPPNNKGGWGWGAGQVSYDPYTRRSNMCPANIGCFDFREAVDDALIQKLYREWREIGPNYFGDYYPLTPYSLDQDAWMAWQYHRPAEGEGMVQVFRRADSAFFGCQIRLQGLDPERSYDVVNCDAEGSVQKSGRELMETGIEVALPQRPGAALLHYKVIS
ncbi:MAG: alpha-galactosidase [Candidatus Hydrogenedentes bacterium]|nr:alpha-galactosidase [Candidatus Hydrogenedentota bacterium]